MTRPRVAVLSPVLPHARPVDAGTGYVRDLLGALEEVAEPTLLVPDTPVNRAASDRPGAAPALLVGAGHAPGLGARAARAVRATADRRLRQLDPGAASPVLAAALRRPGPAYDALAAADVIDLQWSEMIRLAPVVRRVNPRARLVGTYHDVQSQLFAREPARNPADPLYWRWATTQSRRFERRGVRDLDVVVAFSPKDLALLGSPAHGRVVRPPLAPAGGLPPYAAPQGPPTVLFVAHLARPENDDAARWLLSEIWPRVVAEVGAARLRLVGAGASDAVLAARGEDVEVTGFVEDLAAEYARAWCVVVPLRLGAGVKFKTAEAVLRGVPTVATTAGIEGLPQDAAGTVSDDPRGLAAALVRTLTEPEAARARARLARDALTPEFGDQAFREAIALTYAAAEVGRSSPR